MTKHREEEYTFPCAVIRSNEKNVITKEGLMRIMDAKDIPTALHLLVEYGYPEVKELASSREFEPVLRQGLSKVYELVFSIIPDRKELELFLLPNDYHNAKVCLKSEFLGTDPAAMLVSNGTMDGEKLMQWIKERNFIFTSIEMKEAILETTEIFAKTKDPQEVDILLDRACFKEMSRLAKETQNSFIMTYVSLLIDILNINSFIRLRQMGKGSEFFQKIFLEGGQIDLKVFTGNYEEPYQQMADRMAPYGFREIFAQGATSVKDSGKYTLLEKLCDDKKIAFVKDAHYISFGIEPMVGYLIAKESEVKNLRMVLTGKLSGTKPELIKERLRETYV